MKRLLVVFTCLLFAAKAHAVLTPVAAKGEWNTSEASSLQSIVGTSAMARMDSDACQVDGGSGAGQDGRWTRAGAVISVTMIAELAGYAPNNVFGVYNTDAPGQMTTIFRGSAAAGATATETSDFVVPYENFGFFLQNTTDADFTWFSDCALNDDGGKDHMVAYQGMGDVIGVGTNGFAWDETSYVLGWEDLSLGDADYNDMVVLVRGVRPWRPVTPESVPDAVTTLPLLGLALAGLLLARRKSA